MQGNDLNELFFFFNTTTFESQRSPFGWRGLSHPKQIHMSLFLIPRKVAYQQVCQAIRALRVKGWRFNHDITIGVVPAPAGQIWGFYLFFASKTRLDGWMDGWIGWMAS